jgi:hypothetical protein
MKKKLDTNAPWVVTLASPPISMELEVASAELTGPPMVPLAEPEKEARPPVGPVLAEYRQIAVADEPAGMFVEVSPPGKVQTWLVLGVTDAVPPTVGGCSVTETPVAAVVARLYTVAVTVTQLFSHENVCVHPPVPSGHRVVAERDTES